MRMQIHAIKGNGTVGQQNTSFTQNSQCLHPEIYETLSLINPQVKIFFTVIYASYLIFGALLNFVAAYLIFKLKLWENKSTFLVFVISVVESFGCLYTNSLYIVFLWYYLHLHCLLIFILKTTAHFFNYSSSIIICVIGFDRLIRVYYLNRYNSIFTKNRFRLTLSFCLTLTIIQTSLNSFGTKYLGQGYGGILTLPINTILVLFALACQLLCVFRLRTYTKASKIVSREDRSLHRLAFIYIILFSLCNLPGLIYTIFLKTVFLKVLSKEMIGIMTCIVFICVGTSPLINAIAFLIKNKDAKNELKKIIGGIKSENERSNQVSSVIRNDEDKITKNKTTGRTANGKINIRHDVKIVETEDTQL